jgi:hypothetical protein
MATAFFSDSASSLWNSTRCRRESAKVRMVLGPSARRAWQERAHTARRNESRASVRTRHPLN